MPETSLFEQIRTAAEAIRDVTAVVPQVAVITGSGLAGLADDVEDAVSIGYADIPHFPVSSVEGHPGELVVGTLEGVPTVVQRGRVHFYEGYSMQAITLPVRVMNELGAQTLVVTNAAGGLNPAFAAGDIMLIRDHLNLTGMFGFNPLRGPNDARLGPRFPVMAGAYSPRLRRLARQVAEYLGYELQSGVYAGLAGPTFETPAELGFMRLIGADAVGMSTTPEVTVARHSGMEVLGFSLISNLALPDETNSGTSLETSAGANSEPGDSGSADVAELHDEVLEAGQQAAPRLMAIIRGVLRQL